MGEEKDEDRTKKGRSKKDNKRDGWEEDRKSGEKRIRESGGWKMSYIYCTLLFIILHKLHFSLSLSYLPLLQS